MNEATNRHFREQQDYATMRAWVLEFWNDGHCGGRKRWSYVFDRDHRRPKSLDEIIVQAKEEHCLTPNAVLRVRNVYTGDILMADVL